MKFFCILLHILLLEEVICLPRSYLKSMEYLLYKDLHTEPSPAANNSTNISEALPESDISATTPDTGSSAIASQSRMMILPEVSPTSDSNSAIPIAVPPESTSVSCSMKKEYEWLDNLVQFIIERIIRLIILVVKKYIFKQEINIIDFF